MVTWHSRERSHAPSTEPAAAGYSLDSRSVIVNSPALHIEYTDYPCCTARLIRDDPAAYCCIICQHVGDQKLVDSIAVTPSPSASSPAVRRNIAQYRSECSALCCDDYT